MLKPVVYPYRLVNSEVVAVLEELQKAQSMHILKVRQARGTNDGCVRPPHTCMFHPPAQGRYELQVQVQARRLQHRAVLIRALLEHSARHMLVHAVLHGERTELQVGTASAQRARGGIHAVQGMCMQ